LGIVAASFARSLSSCRVLSRAVICLPRARRGSSKKGPWGAPCASPAHFGRAVSGDVGERPVPSPPSPWPAGSSRLAFSSASATRAARTPAGMPSGMRATAVERSARI
jgi:hypothetical protein